MASPSSFAARSAPVVVFLPSDRFFVRVVPLAAESPAAEQVELALEGLAPFPPAQLYWGCWVAPGGTQAVVYAAHRRRFSPEETATWERADLVVPDFLPLLGADGKAARIALTALDDHFCGAAWNENGSAPAAVLARSTNAGSEEKFVAELAAKAGIANPERTVFSGPIGVRPENEAWAFSIGAAHAVVAKAALDLLDVRDRTLLAKRREERRRGEIVWKLLLGGLAAALLGLVLDATALGFGLVSRWQTAKATERAPLVAKLQTAHSLNARFDDLSRNRLRFFEMVSAINASRPNSIRFTRTNSVARNGLEIDAQTTNAADVTAYETALRGLTSLEKVEVTDQRVREGATTFVLRVTFKPGEPAATAGGGQP